MTALERMKMMVENPAAYAAFAEIESGRVSARTKAVHDKYCSNWETWTESLRLIEGGRADITFDGCRKCKTAIARQ